MQAQILRLRYNDPRELLVVRICDLLKISKSMYDRQHRELVRLCAAYDAEKAQNWRKNRIKSRKRRGVCPAFSPS